MTSTDERKVKVLIVDDNPDSQRSKRQNIEKTGVLCELKHPEEVEESDFNDTDVVLVDYVLDEWDERDRETKLSRKPLNGVALASLYRAYVDSQAQPYPTAFAIHTAELQKLARGFPEAKPHVLARLYDLEWIFSKGSENIVMQTRLLASAVNKLPQNWPGDPARLRSLIYVLLSVPDSQVPWVSLAMQDIYSCYPPIHDMSEHTHGTAFVRWLLQRVLPYPCFLMDEHHLAAKLGCAPNELNEILQMKNKLYASLDPYRYSGILSGFSGDRWWKAGIDDLLWNCTEGEPFNHEKIKTSLLSREELMLLREPKLNSPVVCLDEKGEYMNQLLEISQAARIRPDDWPPYADYAWAPVDLIEKHPQLQALRIAE